MVSSSALVFSVKTLLISAGVLCIAVGIKVSVPLILDYAIYKIPLFWSTLLSWLKPPYLYVVINGIIITIVATSRFYQKHDDEIHSYQSAPPKAPPADLPSDFAPVYTQPEYRVVDSPAVDFASEPAQVDYGVVVSAAVDSSPEPLELEYGVVDPPALYEREVQIMDVKPVVVNGSVVAVDEDEDEFEISRSTWIEPQTINPPATSYLYPATVKPLVSSRFSHRKPVKGSFEGGSGKALRVAKPRRHETLENTWKTITDGRHVPLTRHFRKSDTWETHGHQVDSSPLDPSHQMVETFKDRTNYSRPAASSSAGMGKLRKEPSPSQDELNRRVEAFIKKFNEEMRLQRQESLNQYQEMINRGAH